MNKQIESIYSLSPMQEGMLYHKMYNDNSTEYFVRSVMKLRGKLDISKVRKSLDLLSVKYEILRTTFVIPKKGDRPWQVVLKDREIELNVIDLSTNESPAKEIEKIKEDDLGRGFDLEKDSLLRMTIIKLSLDENIMLWSFHHIILDGWCISLLLTDFIEKYSALRNGEEFNNLKEKVNHEKSEIASYEEYIKWLEKQDKESALKYWDELLEGYLDVAEIAPIGKMREIKEEMKTCMIHTTKELADKVKKLAKENNITISTILESGLGILLQKYNRNNDVVFGKVVSGRNADIIGIDKSLGLYINTIPVRIKNEEDITCEELFKRINKQGIDSSSYDFCSLAEIQNQSNLRNGLIKVLFAFENYYVNEELMDEGLPNFGEDLKIESEEVREQTNYPISVSISMTETLNLSILYDPRIFSEEEIKIILNAYHLILEEIVEHSEKRINEIDVINEEEKEKILNEFNDTTVLYSSDKSVVNLFEEQAARIPDKVAVVYDENEITYGELNQKANELAVRLRKLGVKPDDYVAVMAEKRIETIIGICGIIKAGAAYVPLDSSYPKERISYMLEDCKPKALLLYGKECETDVPVIDISEAMKWEGIYENVEAVNKPSDLIYLIYTSGTTGKPKGAMIEHKSVIRLVHKTNYVNLNENTVILQTGSMSFDAATFEIWGSLLNGGKLHLANNELILDVKELKKVIEENGINTMFLTTALFNQLIYSDVTVFDSLETLLFGGEKTSEMHVKKMIEANKKTNLINVYGPTETTTFATYYPISSKRLKDKTPIGKPISNTKVCVVNGTKLCGIGMEGELCIAGDGVARGYLNHPELTSEKFIDNQFGEGKLYRSGDLVRWLPDGNIEFLGRIDEQIKLRGFRIELGEIESVIRKLKNVQDAAVIINEEKEEKNILAYIVSESNTNVDDIREEIKKELPDYMMPTYMVKIDKIPVTRNGKVDKKALPKIEAKSQRKYEAPRDDIENAILKIFEEILDMKKVGIKDNFFELGGHSLKAIMLINQIEEVTKVRLKLRELFSEPTVEGVSKKISGNRKKYESISKAKEKESYLMSSAQKRMFVVNGLDNTGVAYNVYTAIEVSGDLDAESVNNAFNELIKRHEVLRTSFFMKDGEALQKIADKLISEIEYEEVEAITVEGRNRLLSKFIRPFDLGKAPLFRIKVVKVRDGNDLLLFDMHHIISDGVSTNIIMEDFIKLYVGEKLEELDIQYKDYSEWMRIRDISEQKAYWLNEFKDDIPRFDLPLDNERPRTQSFRGKCISGIIEKEVKDSMDDFCRKTGTTQYMVLLSAFMVFLSKYSRQEDIILGSVISGRVHKDTEKILGMFVNTLPMRGEPKGEKTFREFLKEIKEKCLKAQENQEYPFEELVEEVQVNRDISRNPLFDIVFSFENFDEKKMSAEGLVFKELNIDRIIAKFDLTVIIKNAGEDYKLEFEYCSDLFKEDTIHQMISHFKNMLKELIFNSNQKIEEIEVVNEEEKEKILNEFNDTTVLYSSDKSVVNLFEEQAARIPDKVAVTYDENEITYGELNQKANELAVRLRKLGVKPDDYVAVIAEKRIETIISICGIIKAGAAYVPIDPSYPKERISYMLGDCRPKALLVYDVQYETEIPLINMEEAMKWEGIYENVEAVNKPSDLIYLIYTSGTTGKPKGVMIEHKSVIRLVHKTNYVNLDENIVILQTGSMSFDAATFEIWGALLNGGKLHLVNNDIILDAKSLKRVIEENRINTMFLTTALFNQLIHSDVTVFDGLDTLLFGGEKTSEIYVRKLIEAGKQINFANVYGPTETTTFATYYPINDKTLRDKTPIGKPISNTKAYVLNELKLCGIGMIGELCIAGDGVARGYLNHSELTAEKFINNPFGEGKIYRSGDLVRWLPDGNIEYLGRIDDQIKLRGFRIELNEIETVIKKQEGIQNAAVILREKDGEKNIYAYIVAESEISINDIKEKISKELPDYMVPAYIMEIEKIPITTNGKLDRRALPKIEIKSEREYVAPRNETEKVVIKVFEEILDRKRIGIKDSFYELGGDSIKAIRIVSKLKELNLELTIKDIMQMRVLENIFTRIKKEVSNKYQQEAIVGEVPLTPIQQAFFEWNLSEPNHFNQSVALKAKDRLDEEALREALAKLIIHHDILRSVFENNKQKIRNIDDKNLFYLEMVDFTEINEDILEKLVYERNTMIQSSINLTDGPLVKAVVYKTSKCDHLFICIHHLVVDGISWRILIEDLINGYSQYTVKKEIMLPNKTASYLEWSKALLEYSQSEELKNEINYWIRVNEEIKNGKIEVDDDAIGYGYDDIMLVFSEENTSKLLYEVGKAYNTEINDILLTALGISARSWKGNNKLAVTLEGHGREEINKAIDINRTVGWFTSIYPIIIETSEDIENTIIQTKEMLRHIPNNGIGYGVIQEYKIHQVDEVNADICFNYLGHLDSELKEGSEMAVSELPSGRNIASNNKLNNNISINGNIIDGKLTMTIIYDKSKYSNSSVRKFSNDFEIALNKVIEFCISRNECIKTASDYDENLTNDILEELINIF